MTLFNIASNRFFAFYHAEAADTLEAARGGERDAGRQLLVREPSILL